MFMNMYVREVEDRRLQRRAGVATRSPAKQYRPGANGNDHAI